MSPSPARLSPSPRVTTYHLKCATCREHTIRLMSNFRGRSLTNVTAEVGRMALVQSHSLGHLSPPCAISYGVIVSVGTQRLGLIPSPPSREAMTELNAWSVVLGSLQHEGLSPGAEEVGVTALQLPRAYNHYSQGSDLALLRLAHPVAHTPLCLPRPAHRFPFGTSCWATGWDQDTNDGKCWPEAQRGTWLAQGHTASAANYSHSPSPLLLWAQTLAPTPSLLPAPRTLRNLRLRLISRPTCNCLYNRLHQRSLASPARPGMLCGGPQPGMQGPCQV